MTDRSRRTLSLATRGLGLMGCLLIGTPSLAGLLSSAELRIKLKDTPDAVYSGSGATGWSSSDKWVSILAGNAFAGNSTPAPGAPHLHLFGNDTGTLSGTAASAIGGELAFSGDWQPIGGTQTFFYPLLKFGVPTTTGSSSAYLYAYPWTVGPAVLGSWSQSVSPTPITQSGSNALTSQGNGTLVLVTPMVISAPTWGRPPTKAIAELTLVFVPEPGMGVGLLSGASILLLLGRRRMRRGSREASEP